MLVEPHGYQALFQELRADLQSTDDKKVLVFVSTAECDSVCAARILQVLLPPSSPACPMVLHAPVVLCAQAAAAAAAEKAPLRAAAADELGAALLHVSGVHHVGDPAHLRGADHRRGARVHHSTCHQHRVPFKQPACDLWTLLGNGANQLGMQPSFCAWAP